MQKEVTQLLKEGKPCMAWAMILAQWEEARNNK